MNQTRRRFLHGAGFTLAAIPVLLVTGSANASTNESMREKLKYQDTPLSGKECTTCLEFIPGKRPTDSGKCKQIPGDDEISPRGYCTLWNTL